jgi:hypothetical protein
VASRPDYRALALAGRYRAWLSLASQPATVGAGARSHYELRRRCDDMTRGWGDGQDLSRLLYGAQVSLRWSAAAKHQRLALGMLQWAMRRDHWH